MSVSEETASPSQRLDDQLLALCDDFASGVIELLQTRETSSPPLDPQIMIALSIINMANTVRAAARHVVEALQLNQRIEALASENREQLSARGLRLNANTADIMAIGAQFLSSLAAGGGAMPPELLAMLEKATDRGEPLFESGPAPDAPCSDDKPCDHLFDPDAPDAPCLLCQQPRPGGG